MSIWNSVDYTENNIALDAYFSHKLNDVFLTSNTTVGQQVITVEPGHNIVAGDYLEFYDRLHFLQIEVVSVNVNDITLNTPLDNTYGPGTTTVKRVTIDINIDGSVTEKLFCFCGYDPSWRQFLSIRGIITHTAVGDDGVFGDLPALTNGIYIGSERQVTPNLRKITHLWSGLKTNGDIRIRATDFDYSDRAPSGTYGTHFHVDFLKRNVGNILLNGATNDRIFLMIRDNLTTLNSFRIMGSGNIFLK